MSTDKIEQSPLTTSNQVPEAQQATNINNNNNNNINCNQRASRFFSKIGNPFPKSLGKSCLQAAKVLESYLDQTQEQSIIPQSVFDSCKGLVILTMIKGAYVWSGRIGSGLVVARNPDGTWSNPWAIQVLGMGYGAQVGLEISDMVIILRDQDSLNALKQKGNITIGANLTVAIGPYGRNAELDIPVTFALVYSLSKSRGLFAGISLELSLLLQASKTTNKFYGQQVTVDDIIQGRISNVPEEARILNKALNDRFPPPYSSFSSSSSPSSSNPSPDYSSRPSSYVTIENGATPNTNEKASLISNQ